MSWLPMLLLFLVLVVDVWHDPRKLRIGVFTVLLVWLSASWLLGLALEAGDETRGAWFLLGVIVMWVLAVLVLGVFNVMNGVVMLRREARRPAHMLSLFFGLGLIALVGYGAVMFFLDRIDPDAAFEMVRWALMLLLPISYLAFVFLSFLVLALCYQLVSPRLVRNADAVVALGAGLSNGKVTPLLASRLDRARQIHERLDNDRAFLVVSGGQGPDEPVPEAEAMAEHLLLQGVDPEFLVCEDRSRTTQENLEFTVELLEREGLEDPRLAVVTNNFHVMRAALLMRSLRIDGHAIGSPTAGYYWPSAFLREFVAILRDHKVLNVVVLGVLTVPFLVLLGGTVLNLFG